MNEPAHKLSYTFAEYVTLEEASEIKHEFLDHHGHGSNGSGGNDRRLQ